MSFVNRKLEIKMFDDAQQKRGLVIVWGRRRVGKTALMQKWISENTGIFTQCIQGSSFSQISQIHEDLKPWIKIDTTPQTWPQLFQMIDSIQEPISLFIDEFPYLVESDPNVPSYFQKWIDHRTPRMIVLAGSAQHMMYDSCLSADSPLHGRAYRELKINAMSFEHFCEYFKIKKNRIKSFELFCLVGGLPKYWQFLDVTKSVLENVNKIYFEQFSFLENEPQRILSDAKINGLAGLSVLEAVGRGAVRPSEIASRMGIPLTQLSRTLGALVEMGFLKKDIPFGESEKNSKKTQYFIQDQALSFWFSIFSPLRSRWTYLKNSEKLNYLKLHFSKRFEIFARGEASRYWEKDIEFDAIETVSLRSHKTAIFLSEIKYKILSQSEKTKLLEDLKIKWHKSALSKKHSVPEFKLIDLSIFFKS